MKIKCITNNVESLPKEMPKNYSNANTSIKEGKEYIVYALCTYQGYAWYCICNEYYLFYPIWTPFLFFKLIDNRLSRYWIFSLDKDNNKQVPFLSFPEWAQDPYFYGELVEGNSMNNNALIFRKYKELMDLEFSDSSISAIAQIGDEEWLICPNCLEAWQSKSDKDALVRCPKCFTVLNNPRYRNEWPHL